MIEFKRLSDVKKSDIIELMNHPKVRLHMPLAKGPFDDAAYDSLLRPKKTYGATMAMVHGFFMPITNSSGGAGFIT